MVPALCNILTSVCMDQGDSQFCEFELLDARIAYGRDKYFFFALVVLFGKRPNDKEYEIQ